MPLPNPMRGESRDEFIARFMGNRIVQREFPERSQRYAVAVKRWEEFQKEQS